MDQTDNIQHIRLIKLIETICDPLTRAESLGIWNDTNGSNGGRSNVALTDFEVLHSAQDHVLQCYAPAHYIHQFDKFYDSLDSFQWKNILLSIKAFAQLRLNLHVEI